MRSNQSPSIYSIYHNSLPFYLDRADICAVDEETPVFSSVFLDEMLTGKISRQVNVVGLAADKLRHLYFESRNFEKIFGAKSFGFGFPLVIDTFNSDLVVSPVFIWQMQLDPAQTRVDSWVIKNSEQRHILPNYRLLDHLKEKYGLDLKQQAEDLAFSKKIKQEQLTEFCNEIAARLNFEIFGQTEEPIPAPGIDEIGSFTQNGALHWSGVLALYPPQNSRWTPNDTRPEDVFVPKEELEQDNFVFAYQPDDPEQTTALEVIARQKITVVEGEDALGKAQTLVNLLINALSEGKKCLVVSERTQSLKFTQQMLSKAGIFQYHFLLDDALGDKMPLIELLRTTASGGGREVVHNQNAFNAQKTKFLQARAAVQQSYKAVKGKIFGDKDWTETVGLFLASNRIEGKERLASHLNASDFSFLPNEHEQMVAGILRSEPLFESVKTLTHPLSNLKDQIFVNSETKKSQQFVETNLRLFTAKTNELQGEYISQTDNYAARLKEHYRDYFNQLEGGAKGLLEKIQNHTALLGNGFANAGAGSFEWPSFFSSKKKKIKDAQAEVGKRYRAFLKLYEKNPYFDVEFTACKDGLNIPKTSENLAHFRRVLGQWYANSDSLVQEEVMRLNSKTAHPSLDVKEQVTMLEFALDTLIEELNESGLYQKLLENKTLTIPQRQKYLESIMEQLEATQLNMRDFDPFHAWQSNWLGLGVLGQKVVRALVKVKPGDWVAAFESWYFNSLLTKMHSPSLLKDSEAILQFNEAWHQLKPLIFNLLIRLWQEKQASEVKALKKKNKQAFQLIFEKSGQKAAETLPLSKVLENSFDAVSAYLPILFVTPHVALNELPKSEHYFDYVIFDESNKFSVETATAIATLGNKLVIMGSNDSFGNETSLLQYALENGVPSTLISNRYEPPTPISGLVKEDQDFPHQRVSYLVENVEGRFHELEGTNDTEAQTIIRLLNQVKQTPQRIYPSVGIVTFTVEQRDLIANYLLKLKQQNVLGSEKIQQLERNGMGVFHIDELFGQHFDIIIVSCTFGLVNLKGELSKKLVFLNTPTGIGHLRMLVNKPAQAYHIIHSFPDEQIQGFEGKKWEEGTWLLAHFIRLAEATQNGNKPQIMISMEALGKNMSSGATPSIFTNEVIQALSPFIDLKRISTKVSTDSVHFPITVKPLSIAGKAVVLHPDGFFSGTTFTSPLWEKSQRDAIEKAGMVYLPFWSVNWLRNPNMEARLLASKIINHDVAEGAADKHLEDEISLEDKLKE
ncbi:MAG: hypothetical protein K9J37_11245 [Saprospiraceae bacterium]|nr:hypothetical protein [Saprospiraceae bacterium]MCF8250480.1 hypothetical protein [Saprospiraceae bacterium]MCF8281985.1 hypothetical protein [Bacteroidales bacterium]MCF8312374.1 hypothetical protein [Saprospiraceae bacterium]MCF8440629.1 hypothetical protein [Saprospiraceae bacterium]